MTPALTTRGKLVLASSASFMLVGALNAAAPLVALAGVILASFFAAYLWFFPAAVLLRHRQVEIRWWLPPGDQPGGALAADRPLPLHIALRNHGARRLRVLRIEILSTSALSPPTELEAVMSAGTQVEVVGELRAAHSGYHVLHGAVLHFGDILGLFNITAYFPNPMPLTVFPAMSMSPANTSLRLRGGSAHLRQGLYQVRQRGLAGELREIRDFNPGDPFKNIAWKATARHRKLMVRDLENEVVRTHQFLLDIGSVMREEFQGHSALNQAITLISNLAKQALDAGDRVGLITYDTRIYSQIPIGEGRFHYLQILDCLIETHTIVDEDLTDLTNSELVAAVARYLSHQESANLRIHQSPPLDSPDWSFLQAGPKGELYDLRALSDLIESLLATMERTAPLNSSHRSGTKIEVSTDSPPLMRRLRLFAKLRGIELPYRTNLEFGKRAKGLTCALQKLATGPKADHAFVFSDLTSVLEDPQGIVKEFARARRGGRRVRAILPAPPPLQIGFSAHEELVRDVLNQEESLRSNRITRTLLRSGVPLVKLGATDTVASASHKISRARASARRAA